MEKIRFGNQIRFVYYVTVISLIAAGGVYFIAKNPLIPLSEHPAILGIFSHPTIVEANPNR